jgi:hypothetical protein
VIGYLQIEGLFFGALHGLDGDKISLEAILASGRLSMTTSLRA